MRQGTSILALCGVLAACGPNAEHEALEDQSEPTSVHASSDGLPMNGSIETRIGKLDFESGFPSDESVQKLYDEMDFHRHRQIAGASDIDYVAYLSGREKLGILTPNATTQYYLNFADLSATGPLVVEEPQGLTAGAQSLGGSGS